MPRAPSRNLWLDVGEEIDLIAHHVDGYGAGRLTRIDEQPRAGAIRDLADRAEVRAITVGRVHGADRNQARAAIDALGRASRP